MKILFYFLICLIATMAGGISGVGGGVIIKPVMDAVSGLPVAEISFLSGCTVLAMTAVSVFNSRGGSVKIERRRGTLLALGGAIGGIAGKELFEFVCAMGGSFIMVAQQTMMIILTLAVLIYTIWKARIRTLEVSSSVACVIIGVLLGVLSSFLGIGGGPINLMILSFFFSMDSKTAALNSLYIILFSQAASFLNTVISGSVPEFEWPVMCIMVLGGVLGGVLGRKISKRLDNKGIDRIFFVLMIVITFISVYNISRCI